MQFQTTVKRDKKAFLSEQCKEIEKNNRIGKTKENWRCQGNISCKDGHDKGQKWQGPNRSRGCGKNKQNYTKKVLMTQINTVVLFLT